MVILERICSIVPPGYWCERKQFLNQPSTDLEKYEKYNQ